MTSLVEILDGVPAIAVHTDDGDTTRESLAERAAAIATALGDVGVRPGHTVAVQLPNGPELVATLFGVWRAKAIYTPFNPRAAGAEVEANLSILRPAAHVTDAGIAALASAVVVDPAVALVQFTSGTTGRPKPVQLRHDTVLDMLDRVVGSIRKPATARPDAASKPPMPNLVPVSLSLWAGIYQVLFAFRVGAPVVLMDRFDTTTFARLVRQHHIRSTVLPPAALTMLTDDASITDLAPLRIVRSITAPLSPVQAQRFRERFGVVVLNSYGQTELGGEIVGWSTADVREHGATKLGSVGRVHDGVQVRTDATTGELFARTPSTAKGLVDEAFRDRLLDDGWFRTGDLGRIDEDGFVWLDGRVSDMINRGGNKIFPAHVEEVILQRPDVREVAVVGVPDDRLGEVPVAFVVAGSDREVDAVDLAAWCRERLTPYKVPVRFVMIDELPRNDVGKVVKSALVSRGRELPNAGNRLKRSASAARS
jgi:acyl-CoA synthetase (AMP-forming)/AMP-acid ligase II